MNVHLSLALEPLLAIVAGVIILVVPKTLNYVVAIYLIVIGLLGIFQF
jgi:threonine/homoserine efflux transporter RhtA